MLRLYLDLSCSAQFEGVNIISVCQMQQAGWDQRLDEGFWHFTADEMKIEGGGSRLCACIASGKGQDNSSVQVGLVGRERLPLN
ncbi:hypothetical protein SBV1_770002 [Verrucomicrobia bacterium]|nr:hypothetical protein SBV1_770002 [Verrucomicrobiota bacterium]